MSWLSVSASALSLLPGNLNPNPSTCGSAIYSTLTHRHTPLSSAYDNSLDEQDSTKRSNAVSFLDFARCEITCFRQRTSFVAVYSMARNVSSLPSDMPSLISDSDTSDSDNDSSSVNQRGRPIMVPRNPVPPARSSATPATRPAARPDPSVPVSSMPSPANSSRDAHSNPTTSAKDSQRVPSAPPVGAASSVTIPPSHQAPAFRHGSCVRAIGLQSRDDLNGCPGYVCGELDKSTQRWPVTVIKGLELGVEIVKLRGANMTILNDVDAWVPGDIAAIPQNPVSKDRRWHLASLHLIGRKFYCSFRPKIQDFVFGFDMRAGIQQALEGNEACIRSGVSLIFEQFGEIAFGGDDLEAVFSMYFKVLPTALKDLPWNGHKFSSVQPHVSDFRSVPLSQDVFCSPILSMKHSETHSKPVIFSNSGLQTHINLSDPVLLQRGQPCIEAILKLVATISKEVMSKNPTYNVSLMYR